MQGRLHGEARSTPSSSSTRWTPGTPVEGCNYLLALEMEMDPVPGYAIASWEQGYGDFDVAPDLATLRRIPWLEGTALVLGDVALARRHARRSRRRARCCARRSSGPPRSASRR